jgi:hypothetical protein
MNKLMGFYELKSAGIPTVPWKEFLDDTVLTDDILWSVRAARLTGNDYNLPRFIGVTAEQAMTQARNLKEKFKDSGKVICYPYFIAKNSGVMRVSASTTVVEGVDKDLWNLTTGGKCDVTMIVEENSTQINGNEKFFEDEEIDTLLYYGKLLHGKYKKDIILGREIYLEWSYAYKSTVDSKPVGEKYLVFYEMRIL